MNRRQEIRDALNADEFDDGVQYDQTNQQHLYYTPEMLLQEFVLARDLSMLEIGPGSTPVIDGISYLEPSASRAKALSKRLVSTESEVYVGYAEDMEFPANSFDSVVMLNGFFQVQALYEAILEINRVLKMGGRFAFNIHTGDEVNIIVGQVLGYRNLVRTLKQFGFDTLCMWEGEVNSEHRTAGAERQAFIVMEKVRNATANDLNQPQLVPWTDDDMGQHEGLYRGVNVDLNGRESYLA
jgi:SAM-dependent methyltransferase